jgi:5-methylcytosine-specific restriction protein A
MNSASAKMYINNFKCLIEGKHYTRIMKLEDTKYYIGMIYQDYGKKGLRNALNALSQHIHYLKTKGIGSPGALEKIYEKWRLRTI